MKNLLIIISIVIIGFACKKEAGPQGPTGPQGIQGIQGIQGNDGNANVHNYSFSATSANWTLAAPNYYAMLNATGITQDILDNGAVLVYKTNTATTGWLALPYVSFYSGYTRQYNAVISLGSITIWVSDSDLTQTPNPGTMTFKVVTIAGQTLPSNIDKNDYNAVMNYLNK